MNSTDRLEFVRDFTDQEYNALWSNCFESDEDYQHVHAHVPTMFAIPPNGNGLKPFLQSMPHAWLIKKKDTGDIIGFVVHGNYGGLVNNIGLNIGLRFLRNGYAKETLASLLNYLRSKNMKETYGQCLSTNTGVIQLMEQAGFVYLERTGRKFYDHPNAEELKFKIEL